jgi:hypothetical protein
MSNNKMTDFNSWDNRFDEKQKASIVKWRNERTKHAKRQLPILLIIGVLFFAGAIHMWYFIYNMSLESNLGVVAGLILAFLGFHVINQNRVASYKKLFAEDFTSEDVKEYFEEEFRVNIRFLKQYKNYGWVIPASFFVLAVLLALPQTEVFATMMLITVIPVFLMGIVILVSLSIRQFQI